MYQEVSISTDGNWVIGGVETKHHAVAVDGVPGLLLSSVWLWSRKANTTGR